jgi:hypothetical protein
MKGLHFVRKSERQWRRDPNSNSISTLYSCTGYMDGPLALNMLEKGVKRQDLDHVFLRFGRRRRR